MLIRFADCRQELPAACHLCKVIHKPSGTELADVIAANADEQWIERYVSREGYASGELPVERIENCQIEIRLPDDAPRCSRDVDAGVFYDTDLPAAERVEAEQRVMDMSHQRSGNVQSVKEFVYQITGKNLASCFKDGEISFPIEADCEVHTRMTTTLRTDKASGRQFMEFSGLELKLVGSPYNVQAVVDGLETHFANLNARAGLNAMKERQARETLDRSRWGGLTSEEIWDAAGRVAPSRGGVIKNDGVRPLTVRADGTVGIRASEPELREKITSVYDQGGRPEIPEVIGKSFRAEVEARIYDQDVNVLRQALETQGAGTRPLDQAMAGGKLEAWELRRPEAREIIRMVQMSKWDNCARNDPDLLKAIRAEYQANPELARKDPPEAILPLAKNPAFERADPHPSDYFYALGTSTKNY